MTDQRVRKAAEVLVDYSTRIKKGDGVQIISEVNGKELALECYRLAVNRGAIVSFYPYFAEQSCIYYKHASKEQIEDFPSTQMYEIKRTDSVIYINAPVNTRMLSSADPEKIALRRRVLKPISDWRVQKTRWVLFYMPTNALAQEADMSLSEFEDFVFKATNIDWAKESKKQDKLKQVLDNGRQVRIVSKDADISFSIKGRQGTKCDGRRNMPDGEVFIAPVERTVEGHVRYSFPAIYDSHEVDGIRLVFKKGRVVEAHADKNEAYLKRMISLDKGSCYVGEFGIGVNYRINSFVKCILFDEKIGGTVHLALGMAYKEGGGRNKSALHWDMILDLRKGGAIYVDGKLIERGGRICL
ncbi:TPA: aminopeptidase [Candidatus Woesearchaeota archaeon]|nr:aminopeptidase [Candidatus Woesearchaeota archaeon]